MADTLEEIYRQLDELHWLESWLKTCRPEDADSQAKLEDACSHPHLQENRIFIDD